MVEPVERLSANEVEQALVHESNVKREAALAQLMGKATDQERVGLLVLQTQDCLATVSDASFEGKFTGGEAFIADRSACVKKGGELKVLLDRLSVNNRPDSALVLSYLIDTQLSGLPDSTVQGLGSSQITKLKTLCGDGRLARGGALQASFERALRLACQAHIRGNGSEAMLHYARAKERSLALCSDNPRCDAIMPSILDNPTQAAWSTFKSRLFQKMGINLMDTGLPRAD